MILPHLENAVVPPEKLTDYLLSDMHPKGKAKAEFFRSFGFTASDWPELANALLGHLHEHGVDRKAPSPFGVRYIVEGRLKSPDGRDPNVRAIWFLDAGSDVPRFATAYPLDEVEDD